MTDNTCTGEIYLTSKIWPYTRKYAVHVHITGGGGQLTKGIRICYAFVWYVRGLSASSLLNKTHTTPRESMSKSQNILLEGEYVTEGPVLLIIC